MIQTQNPHAILIPFLLKTWHAASQGCYLPWQSCPELSKAYIKRSWQGSRKGWEREDSKYQELAHKYIVMPVAVETMGAWGNSSLKFVQEIGERIKMASGDNKQHSSFSKTPYCSVQTWRTFWYSRTEIRNLKWPKMLRIYWIFVSPFILQGNV